MRNGWYITPASAGDYEEVEYLLFEVTAPLKYTVAKLRRSINQLESELGGWGSICINGVISIVALKNVPAVVGPTCDDLDELDFGGGAFLFVGDYVDVDAIAAEDVWRSECHAVRVSARSVYIRALARSNSHEAESDDLSAIFEFKYD